MTWTLIVCVSIILHISVSVCSDKHLDNPVYNAVTQSIELKQHPTRYEILNRDCVGILSLHIVAQFLHVCSTTTNGNGMVHKQDGETLYASNNLHKGN